jgi:oligopeptide transport system substrate-binding protein
LTSYPVPKHVVEAFGDDWVRPGNMVSNGAYVLAEWRPQTHIMAVKNPMFFDADNVKIETVFYYPTEDRSAALRRFRAGELHMNQDFPADQIDWLRENLPTETRIAPYLGIYYYAVNLLNPPFDQTAVRQALSMAIDRETIVDYVMRTGEVAAYSLVPPGVGNYGDPVLSDWAGRPMGERQANAQALLAQAGFGDDNPLEVEIRYNTSENHKKVAIAVTAMWQSIGVRATLFNTEVAVHYNDLQEGNFQIGRAGWIADYNDAQNFLFLNQTSTEALNYARYSNPEFDALMELAAVTADLKVREGYLRQAEALFARDQPLIPIYYYISKNLVSQLVTGYEDAANNVHRSRWMEVAED